MDSSTTQRRERFESLIAEAEAHLKANPDRFRLRLALLTGLGYVYFYGVLLLLPAVAVGGVVFAHQTGSSLLLFAAVVPAGWLCFFTLAMIHALCRESATPVGHRVRANECPALFDAIRQIRRQLNAPPFHRVLLTQGFNAYVHEAPLLGVFGQYRNTLVLGLPLLLSLSPQDFRSVLAHEFAHLSSDHCRFGSWMRRVRTSWIQTMEVVEMAGFFSRWVFGRFFDRYDPILRANFFVYARLNEYQADAMAARITSKQSVAQTLAQVQVHEQLVEEKYWDRVTEQCDVSPEVNLRVFTEMHAFIGSQPFSDEERQDCLKRELEKETDPVNTHPALKDRLQPLVKDIALPDASPHSAAQEFLGDALASILAAFDRQWAEENEPAWKERHTYVTGGKEALNKLEEKHRAGEMTPEELWELATWTEELKPQTDPLPLYRMAWNRNRDVPETAFALGRLLLARKDASGIGFLDSVMHTHPRLAIPACELACDYFRSKGDAAAVEKYRLRAEAFVDLEARAEAERRDLIATDEYLEHGLPQSSLTAIQQQLENFETIRHAWICRKKVDLFPEEPIHVLILQKKGWFTSEETLSESVIETLEMPGDYFLICRNGEKRSLARKALKTAEKIF